MIPCGYLQVFKEQDGYRETVYSESNAAGSTFYYQLMQFLCDRSTYLVNERSTPNAGVTFTIDGIGFGSSKETADFDLQWATWVGTFAHGTNSCFRATMTTVNKPCATFYATYAMGRTSKINWMQLGAGSKLLYAPFDSSIPPINAIGYKSLRGTNALSYGSTATMYVEWSISF
jgi:hypothetical protein